MYSEEEVKNFYSFDTHLYGLDDSVIRTKLREFLVSLGGKRYFEFGYNCGANLDYIKHHSPLETYVAGMDINSVAVNYAQMKFDLDVEVGDEITLDKINNNVFDVVFTSSVLNHMIDIKTAVWNLKRITKKYVVCMEANIIKEPDYWSHDYLGFGFKKEWEIFSPESIGGHDVLYECFIWES